MQALQITDIGGTGASYNRDGGESINRSTYTENGVHTLTSRSLMQLYRTYPKRNGNSRGSSKTSVKFTLDVSVPNADGSGNIVLPVIWEISGSVPVGGEAAAVAKLAVVKGFINSAEHLKLVNSLDI